MKNLLYLIVVCAIGYFAWQYVSQPIQLKQMQPAPHEIDPIQAMAQVVASFPKNTTRGSNGNKYPIVDVSYDVKKTDSLVNPMVGYINFTETGIVDIDFQFVFQWKNENWHFTRIICRENGKDFTNLPNGIEMMQGSPMREFLAKYQ